MKALGGYFLALFVVLVALIVALPARASDGVIHNVPGVTFTNATYTGAPSCETMLIPSMNSAVPLRVCAIVRRPPEGGGLYLLTLFTADGLLFDRDLRAWGYEDAFGGDPWCSGFTGTIKVMVNAKPPDGGNDRTFFPLDTGLGCGP